MSSEAPESRRDVGGSKLGELTGTRERGNGRGGEVAGRDIVVIGASAGGVEPLRDLITSLPADLPAAVFVVMHVASGVPSVLPRILGRRAQLPVEAARDGDPVKHGRVYVAPADFHMLLHGERVRVVAGPRENSVRPAVDPLFRSAAAAYGERVIGIVLSGSLDDGTLGLSRIKQAGGIAIVQDPSEALFDGMPRNAMERVVVDHVVPVAGVAPLLERLTREPMTKREPWVMEDELEEERDAVEIDGGARTNEELGGHLSGFTCPECHGALWEIAGEDVLRYRCRVGHAYTEDTFHAAKGITVEAALWTALTAMEEQAAVALRMARRAESSGNRERHRKYEQKALRLGQHARLLHQVLHSRDLTRAASGELGDDDVAAP